MLSRMSDSSPPRLLVVQKKFPQEIINEKMYIPTDFGPKKICPREICSGIKRLFTKNYEVNDKSRLEIKHVFFNLIMTHE